VVPRHVRAPLVADLRTFADPDRHADARGCYVVRSLYLDTHDFACFHEKLAGVSRRQKLRIRGYPDKDGRVSAAHFEIKYRSGNRISKDVAKLGLGDYQTLAPVLHMHRIPAWDWGNSAASGPALARFFAIKQMHAMTPVVNIQYRRQALFVRCDRRLRITFDDRLLARRARDLRDAMGAARPLLDRGDSIFEVKFDRRMPYWLARLIGKYHLRRDSISKYAYAVANGLFGMEGLF